MSRLIDRARGVFQAARSHEWWGYKLPPLLSVGYAVAARADVGLYELAPYLVFLLTALAVGAAYVSILNDWTDMDEDARSGKSNRMAALPAWQRAALLGLTLVAGAACFYFLRDDGMATICYAASWMAFTLYSLSPFRLKKRGVLGVLADACGAHLFPSLFLFFAVSYHVGLPINWIWAVAIGAWSFCYGLRGILWHQLSDRANDIQVGLKTFATTREPRKFKETGILLLVIELAQLFVFIWLSGQWLPFVFLGLYGLLLLVYRRIPGMRFLVVLPLDRPTYHILMSSYYQILLPLSFLFADALAHPRGGVILLVHLLLFSGNLRRLGRDLQTAFKDDR